MYEEGTYLSVYRGKLVLYHLFLHQLNNLNFM